ncbi:hypothetical protein SAMN05216439_1946 [Methanobrevibacter gottschalkii]|uniref:Uncharacterized protein n=2 Tax=Methanobrevibacter gottschalkii TaxID=190974 RepID=A0A3N5B162_9EURY|nr:hypothetical protein [Methanobrevibacter gottschalkii]RPF51007.1 hypothetical protein EDC42_1671 [Methanobrevibacter gottschalkii DSM 11977]SEL09520.1 hypothetical protein SAMN05216439_1946 [Methanobrevibacter gottschalkii]
MAEYTSIRIRKDLAEQMQIIKKQNNYKSINELLEKTLDKTVNENMEVIQEQALFYIGETPITWTELKQSTNGTRWNQGNETVTILFKDNQGAFIRFEYENEVEVEYYHFI